MDYLKANHFKVLLILLLLAITFGNPWSFGINQTHILEYKDLFISFALIGAIPLIYKNIALPKIQLSNTLITLYVFLIYSSISFLWIGADLTDKIEFFDKWLSYFLAAVLIYSVAVSYDSTYKYFLIYGVIISALVVSFLFFGQLYLSSNISLFQLVPLINSKEPGSTFGNVNAVSHFLVFVTPLSIYLTASASEIHKKLFGLLSFFIFAFFIYKSNTLASVIALIFQIFLFLLIYLHKRKLPLTKILANLFLVLILAFYTHSFFSNSNDFISNIGNEISKKINNKDSPRKYIYQASLIEINKSPIFGHGLGSFIPRMHNNGATLAVYNAHNTAIQMTLELGLFGFLIFLSFLYYFSKDILSLYKQNSDHLFYISLFIGIIGSFVIGMFSWPYSHLTGYVMFSIYTGIIIRESKKFRPGKNISITLPYLFFLKILIVLLILFFPLLKYEKIKANNLLVENFGLWGNEYNQEKISENIVFDIVWAIGKSFEYQDNGDKETRLFEIVSSTDRDNSFASLRLVENYINQGRIDDAENVLVEFSKFLPNNPHMLQASMKIAVAKKNIDLVAKAYDNLKKSTIRDSEKLFKDYRYYTYLIYWGIKTQNFKDAIFAYKFLDNLREKQYGIEIQIADAYFGLKDYEGALPHIKYLIAYREDLVKKDVIDLLVEKKLLTKDELNELRKKSVKKALEKVIDSARGKKGVYRATPEIKYLLSFYPKLIPESIIDRLIELKIISKEDIKQVN